MIPAPVTVEVDEDFDAVGDDSIDVSRDVNASADLAQPERVGDYRLIGRFHSGQTARVFLGERTGPLGFKSVAVIKWVPSEVPDFDDARRSLIDEATALSAVRHPNVVGFRDAAEDERGAYLAVEYVPGSDLKTIMVKLFRDRRRLSIPMVCYVLAKVLHGVHAAHIAVDAEGTPLGIVHRDVTPSNVLLSYYGEVKVTDFGIVRMSQRAQVATLPGVVKGKFRYMAPEYVEGQQLNVATDIYAAGVTLFELLAGLAAFAGKNQVEVFRAILSKGLPLSAMRERLVPEPLIEIVQRATNRKPELRYQTAAHMAFALEAWLGESGTYLSSSVVAHTLRSAGLLYQRAPVISGGA